MIALRTVRRASRVEKRNRGFTLLEMLLVTILTATLMAGIWGISSLYLGLLKSGKRKTEEAQLVRALTRQISEDLLGVVQPFDDSESPAVGGMVATLPSSVSATLPAAFDSAASGTNTEVQADGETPFSISAASTLPQFELMGTARELRLNVLQVVPPETVRHAEPYSDVAANQDSATIQPALSRVPELKTIVYTFEEPRESVPNDRRPPVGLMRRELSWEQTFSAGSATTFGRQPAAFTKDANIGFASVLEPYSLESDESVDLIPEVVAIEFRYFDGQAWGNEWDSRAQQSLPVAVEVVMRIMSLTERQQLYGSPGEPGRVDREQIEMDVQTMPARGHIYRKLIFLPAARNPHTESVRSALGETPFPVTSDPLFGARP